MRTIRLLSLVALNLMFLAGLNAQITIDSISSSATRGCGQLVTSFTPSITSTNPIVFYDWDFGDGTNRSNIDRPGHIYTPSSNPNQPCYSVRLSVRDNAGNTATLERVGYICVYRPPTIDFAPVPGAITQGCAPLNVCMQDLSVAAAGSQVVSWVWNSGGGVPNSVGLPNSPIGFRPPGTPTPCFAFNATGNYAITLQVRDDKGCLAILQKTDVVKVVPTPRACFTSSTASSCTAPLTVNFDASCTPTFGQQTTYDWDFGDGTPRGTGLTPSHTYSGGSYTVTLITSGVNGCKDTLIQPALVNVGGTINFSFAPTNTCIGTPIQFTGPAGATSSVWTFDPAITCSGGGATPANSIVPDPTTVYTCPGTYFPTVRVTLPGGCVITKQSTIPLVIGVPPTATFSTSPARKVCSLPYTASFTNNAVIAGSTCDWNFGDGPSGVNNTSALCGTVNHTYIREGVYPVTLTITNAAGCATTFVDTVTIKKSKARFTLSKVDGCVPFTSTITENSSPNGFTITNRDWYVDGVLTSSGTTPAPVSITTCGPHTVRLVITNSDGCKDTLTQTVKGGIKPTGSFSFTPAVTCAQTQVCYTPTIVAPLCPVDKAQWFYGDSYGSSLAANCHLYRDTGHFRPWLILESSGCKSDTIACAPVNPGPPKPWCVFVQPTVAKIKYTPDCANKLLITLDGSTSIGADVYSWAVSPNTFVYANGTSSSSAIPQLQFTQAQTGTYTVTLTTTNIGNGCTQSATREFTVASATPTFNIGNLQGCQPFRIASSSTIAPAMTSSIRSYAWYLPGIPGSGVVSTTTDVNYGIYVPGIYPGGIKLIVTDKNGCKDSLSNNATFTVAGPKVNFTATPNQGCIPFTVQLADSTVLTPATATIAKIYWDFGNDRQPAYYDIVSGSPPTAAELNPSITITRPGAYPIKLKIEDTGGCIDSIVLNRIIGNGPTSVFTRDSVVCTGQTVNLKNLSAVTGVPTYNWSFGAGSGIANSTLAEPVVSYTAEGNYSVCLTTTDPLGCPNQLCQNVYVRNPKPNFTADTTKTFCPPLFVRLTSTAVNVPKIPAGQNTRWYIYKADCVTGIAVFPEINVSANDSIWDLIFPEPGCYTVKMVVIGASGCRDSITKDTMIRISGPVGSFTLAPTRGCQPLSVKFTGVNIRGQTAIAYDTDDPTGGTLVNNTTAIIDSVRYIYTRAGVYSPRVVLQDNNGCNRIFPLDDVTVDSIGGRAGAPPPPICIGDTARLNGACYIPAGTCNFTWTQTVPTPTIHPSDLTLPNPRVFPIVSTTYVVNIADPITGCSKTDTVRVIVKPFPLPTVTITPNTTTICPGTFIQLVATGAGNQPSAYQWDPATVGLSCYAGCFNPIATPTTASTYTVTVTGAGGCTKSGTAQIAIENESLSVLGPDTTICKGGNVQLAIQIGQLPLWSPSVGLSCVSCPNPVASPIVTTKYVVEVTSPRNCRYKDTITVFVLDPKLVSAGPDKANCVGTPVQLSGSVPPGGTIAWSAGATPPDVVNPSVNPAGPGPEFFVMTYTNDLCIVRDTALVRPLPSAEIAGIGGTICEGDTVQLNVEGFANTYAWTPGTNLSSTSIGNPKAWPTQTTTYTVVGSLGGNCANSTISITVNVNKAPTLTLSPNGGTYFENQKVNIKLTTDAISPTIGWTAILPESPPHLTCYNCANPVFTSAEEKNAYRAVVTDINGCVSTADIELKKRTKCAEDMIFVPNAFTPNGDGKNDILYARGSSLNGITIFRVFDRWGTLVFETKDINKGWDGTFGGKLVNPDVYVYYVEAPCALDGQAILKKGNVTVIR